jgi:hypothetical protein
MLDLVLNKDPQCEIMITMLSVVKVTMKFDVDFSDFYTSNKQATLINKLAAFLGVGEE